MRICYLVSEVDDLPLLSSFVVAGFDITLVLSDDIQPFMLPADIAQLSVCSLSSCHDKNLQAAIAPNWRAALDLFRVPSEHHVLLLERLWHEQFAEDNPAHLVAKSSLQLPVSFLTTNSYVADVLHQLRPDTHCLLVSPAAIPEDIATDQEPITFDITADPVRIASLLAAGQPVITFATPETTTLIDHDVNGFLVDADDNEGAKRLQQTVEQDSHLARRLSDGAKVKAREMPTIADVAHQLQTMFATELTERFDGKNDWPANLLTVTYQQAVFLHERCETRREELHDAQRSENEAHAELARFKDTLESDRFYRLTQKVRRRF